MGLRVLDIILAVVEVTINSIIRRVIFAYPTGKIGRKNRCSVVSLSLQLRI